MFSRLKIATKLLIGFGTILLLLVGNQQPGDAQHDAVEGCAGRRREAEKRGSSRTARREAGLRGAHAFLDRRLDRAIKSTGTNRAKALLSLTNGSTICSPARPTRSAPPKRRKCPNCVKSYRKLVNRLRFTQQQNGTLTADEISAGTADAVKIEDVMTKLGEELATDYKNASESDGGGRRGFGEFRPDVIVGAGGAGLVDRHRASPCCSREASASPSSS